jgi:hypothetical protein
MLYAEIDAAGIAPDGKKTAAQLYASAAVFRLFCEATDQLRPFDNKVR